MKLTKRQQTLFRGNSSKPVDLVNLLDAVISSSSGAIFAGGPNFLSYEWVNTGKPVIQIEVGWGTGTYVDCYANADGALYTSAGGGTRIDSTYAGANKLLVHRIYNQAGSDPSTDYISAISDDLRVLLDISVPTNPAFAGYSTGTQDANQHATQRGYALPAAVNIKTNDHPFSAISIHEAVGSHTENVIQDAAAGTTAWFMDPNVGRHYTSWDVNVRSYPYSGVNVPFINAVWEVNDSRGQSVDYTARAALNGVFTIGSTQTSTATDRALNLYGPTASLRGRSYAIIIFEGTVDLADMVFGGIPTRAARLITNRIATDKPSIGFPFTNCTVPMNLDTGTADIPVRLIGKPNKAYEASWQGGAYVGIGTTNADGVLSGAMTGQSAGSGTFAVREVGGTTPVSIATVAVGIVIYAMGESGADGRGDDVTHTIPAGWLRLNNANWSAASKEWWKVFCQALYDQYTAPISVLKVAIGSSYFYFPTGGATVKEGQWSATPGTGVTPYGCDGIAKSLGMGSYFLTPNFWIWDIGLNDASLSCTKTQFKTHFTDLLTAARARTGNSNLEFWPIISGPNGAVTPALTDAIREAELELWETSGFRPLGCFAHLNVGVDGVHLWTQADKDAATAVVWRTVFGTGRGPRYSSMTASGTSIVVTLTGGVSPMTISIGSDVAGWGVTDGNGARTVSNVAVSGLQVTLTVDQALSGTVTTKWSSGSTAIGTTLIDSDLVTPLPPEPFSASVTAT